MMHVKHWRTNTIHDRLMPRYQSTQTLPNQTDFCLQRQKIKFLTIEKLLIFAKKSG